jgi:hypothetical protein
MRRRLCWVEFRDTGKTPLVISGLRTYCHAGARVRCLTPDIRKGFQLRLPFAIVTWIVVAMLAVFPIVMQASALTMDRHGATIVAAPDRTYSINSIDAGGCSDSSSPFDAGSNGCGAATSETHRCPSDGLCCDDAIGCHTFTVEQTRLVIGEPVEFAALEGRGTSAIIPSPPALSARLERPPRAG